MKRSRILVVDDEQHIADVVVYVLEQHGYEVCTALDGEAGRRLFEQRQPDLVVLDLNLPGISGMDLFRQMRQTRPKVPIIMLTSRSEEVDRVIGLEVGADDYVTKPFSPRELAARVRAVLRRTEWTGDGSPPARLRFGPIELDSGSFHLTYFGTRILLTRPEFRLVESLVRFPARVFTRDMLVATIHDGENVVTDRSIDACVKRVRRKFVEIRPGLDPIQTVYGLGYKLNQDLEGAA
jgi:DNA-binding response OmpR family regulator